MRRRRRTPRRRGGSSGAGGADRGAAGGARLRARRAGAQHASGDPTPGRGPPGGPGPDPVRPARPASSGCAREIAALEESQRQLELRRAGPGRRPWPRPRRRADELGILAGTLPAAGPGPAGRASRGETERIKAATVLDAVQELRGAGAEAMQIAGRRRRGGADRRVDVLRRRRRRHRRRRRAADRARTRSRSSATRQTMQTALNIPGGVVDARSGSDGGNVTMDEVTVGRRDRAARRRPACSTRGRCS